MLALGGQGTDGGIGEGLPAQRGMAVGLMGTDRQGGVEQQYALFGPACEVATQRDGCAEVLLNLLEDVLQRRGKQHTVLYGEAQPMCLAWLMVGVLSDDDHLDLVEGTEVEGIEDERARRIACACPVFLTDGSSELGEVGFDELALQLFLPRRFYLYIHYAFVSFCLQRYE